MGKSEYEFINFLAEIHKKVEKLEEEVKTLKEQNSGKKLIQTIHQELKDKLDINRAK